MGNKVNFDVRNKGGVLYIGIVQMEDDQINDVEVLEYDLDNYQKYVSGNRDYNNYDYMLIGFNELIKTLNANKVYEEGDLTVEYNNKILFNWLSKGLNGKSKVKYGLMYETILNNLEELINNLGESKVRFNVVKKNIAKKHLTDSKLLAMGKVSDENVTEFELSKDSNLSKNRVRKVSRVTGDDLNKKVIELRNISG